MIKEVFRISLFVTQDDPLRFTARAGCTDTNEVHEVHGIEGLETIQAVIDSWIRQHFDEYVSMK